jgi:hypothetical protein
VSSPQWTRLVIVYTGPRPQGTPHCCGDPDFSVYPAYPGAYRQQANC